MSYRFNRYLWIEQWIIYSCYSFDVINPINLPQLSSIRKKLQLMQVKYFSLKQFFHSRYENLSKPRFVLMRENSYVLQRYLRCVFLPFFVLHMLKLLFYRSTNWSNPTTKKDEKQVFCGPMSNNILARFITQNLRWIST